MSEFDVNFTMATSQQLAQQIERLLASGANNQALSLCDTVIATSKREIEAWLGRARANLALAKVCVADENLEMALRLAPFHAQARLPATPVVTRVHEVRSVKLYSFNELARAKAA